ncbi:MAG TPA: ATP-binding protein [bacterium]|nr:ATP-binding protein [bacterium]
MRDLSLHVLDLMENSVRAGATHIDLLCDIDTHVNRLVLRIQDNGAGLLVSHEQALDPFYTTKDGKKTGLGLSLFQAAAEAANGNLELSPSPLGGLSVQATMEWDHLDRSPVGDLVESIFSLLCTEPDLDVTFQVRFDDRTFSVRVSEVVQTLSAEQRNSFEALIHAKEALREVYRVIPELYGA